MCDVQEHFLHILKNLSWNIILTNAINKTVDI